MQGSLLRDRSAAALLAVVAGSWVAGARGQDQVLVSVTGQLQGRVGERVSFEVELVNRSGRPLQRLRVIDYFDPGFQHEASKSPIEQKGTIDLAPGTARRLTLDFLLVQPGRQCHRVEILDQSHVFVGGGTHCVEVQPAVAAAQPQAAPVAQPQPVQAAPLAAAPPAAAAVAAAPLVAAPLAQAVTQQAAPPIAPVPPTNPVASTAVTAPLPAAPALELDLVGPAEAVSDTVVSYVATIKNNGTGSSSPTTFDVSWDDALTPLEASDGYSLAGGRVSWSLPAIEPGGQVRRQVNLRAKAAVGAYRDSPATRSCVRAVLGGLGGGAMIADEACVLVSSTTPRPRLRSPGEAGLRLSLADLDDPVAAGDSTTLVCTVINGGIEPSGRLDLVILLPERARLDADRTADRVRIDDSRVAFEPIQGIPPGGQRSFELTYRLPPGGRGRASAMLTGVDLEGALERGCETTFLEP